MAVCVALAFSSCKSSESAYKKAYEKAKQQELAEKQQEQQAPAVQEVAPVVTPVVESAPAPAAAATVPAGVRQEKVSVVSGGTLKDFSVVCGAYSVKANAEGVKDRLAADGYAAMVVYNAERGLYRVVVGTCDNRPDAESLRDSFKSRYPADADFQKAWLLYNAN